MSNFNSIFYFEVEKLCKRVVLIHRGKIITDGPPSKICRELAKEDLVEVKIRSTPDHYSELTESGVVQEMISSEYDGETATAIFRVRDVRSAFSEIPDRLMSIGCRMVSIKIAELSLEEAFIRLTRE